MRQLYTREPRWHEFSSEWAGTRRPSPSGALNTLFSCCPLCGKPVNDWRSRTWAAQVFVTRWGLHHAVMTAGGRHVTVLTSMLTHRRRLIQLAAGWKFREVWSYCCLAIVRFCNGVLSFLSFEAFGCNSVFFASVAVSGFVYGRSRYNWLSRNNNVFYDQ